jgi:hypothetical protein
VTLTKVKKSDDAEPTVGTLRQDIVDNYRNGHFDSIHNLKDNRPIREIMKTNSQRKRVEEITAFNKNKKKEVVEIKESDIPSLEERRNNAKRTRFLKIIVN